MLRILLAIVRTAVAGLVQGLATFCFGSYLIVLLKVRPDSPQPPAVMRIWGRLFLWVTGTRVVIEGADRVRPGGSYVFVGNHSSNLDIPVIMAKVPASVRFLAKKELFKVPVLAGAMRAVHMVETDRRLGPTAHRAINEQVSRVVAAGLSLMIFPEGTRTSSGEMMPFKKGAFRIAIDNGMPIVPITIIGAFRAWKPHSKLIHGGRVRLVIHDPIPTEGLDHSDITDLRDRARRIVATSYREAMGSE